MGASSVTGISGPGSVAGNQKGSEHMSLGVNKLIGPRVVAAGSETLVGTTGVVEIPELPGVPADYIVMTTGVSATVSRVTTPLAAVANTDTWNFTITGGSGEVVHWTVIKKGL
jgi:hypothetical protein